MKKLLFTTALLGSMFANELPEEFDRDLYNQGEKVFENKCMECHQKSMPIPLLMKNFIEENNKTLNLKAPTGNEISFRLKQQIGNRERQRAERERVQQERREVERVKAEKRIDDKKRADDEQRRLKDEKRIDDEKIREEKRRQAEELRLKDGR